MQENHSFDNYFGTFPGANGIPANTCMPVGHAPRPCVRPFHLGDRSTPDLAHEVGSHRMDGFVRAASRDRQSVVRAVMGYYDGRDLPFYWNVADEYVLFDRFFAASPAGSVANHRLWVSGIFRRLQERGISWKFYVQDYDPRLGEGSAQAVRVPLRDPRLSRHIVDLDEYYSDLERGRLPAVAYIAPAGASEHPPGRIAAGATLTRALVTALARSSAWDSSAFLWTYDESGGWFDHVRPPHGEGFRVPALLVSPYARRGFVDSTPLDTTSIPAFVERNWGLARRTPARTFERAFDFARAPREPSIPAAERRPAARRGVRLWVIYVGYGAALVLSGILIGWVGLRRTLVVTALLAVSAAPAAAQAPDTIQTVPAVPGMRFSLGGVEFRADAAGRSASTCDARRLADGANHRRQARRPRAVRPLVRRPPDRRSEPGVPSRLPLRRPQRQPGRSAGGQLAHAGRQQRPPPSVQRLEAAVAAGQPRDSGEWRHEIDSRRLRGAEGTRRGLVGRPRGAATLLPRRDPQPAAPAPAVLGSLRGPGCSARLPDRLRRPPRVSERQGSAADPRPRRGADLESRCLAATTT